MVEISGNQRSGRHVQPLSELWELYWLAQIDPTEIPRGTGRLPRECFVPVIFVEEHRDGRPEPEKRTIQELMLAFDGTDLTWDSLVSIRGYPPNGVTGGDFSSVAGELLMLAKTT